MSQQLTLPQAQNELSRFRALVREKRFAEANQLVRSLRRRGMTRSMFLDYTSKSDREQVLRWLIQKRQQTEPRRSRGEYTGAKVSRMSMREITDTLKLSTLTPRERENLEEGLQQRKGFEGYNNPKYTHFVVVWPGWVGDKQNKQKVGAKIESGWEHREDAKERSVEIQDIESEGVGPFSRLRRDGGRALVTVAVWSQPLQ